jgi:hypothetical protein
VAYWVLLILKWNVDWVGILLLKMGILLLILKWNVDWVGILVQSLKQAVESHANWVVGSPVIHAKKNDLISLDLAVEALVDKDLVG